MEWTLERLQALSVHDRSSLYANASRLAHTPKGAALKALLDKAGLPFSEDACLTMDDPITLKMIEIINSTEVKSAALRASKRSSPPCFISTPCFRKP